MAKECSIDICKYEVKDYCYHCSQDLCNNHLIEHKKWIEEELLPIVNEVNNIYDEFQQFEKDQTIFNAQYVSDARDQLDQWRIDCYHHIDQIYDRTRLQIANILEKHKINKIEKTKENRELINKIRRQLGELLSKDEMEYRQIQRIKEQLEEMKRNEQEQITYPNIRILTEKVNLVNLIDVISDIKHSNEQFHKQTTRTFTLSHKNNSVHLSSPSDSDEEYLKQPTTNKVCPHKKSVRSSLSTSQKPIDKRRTDLKPYPKHMFHNDRIQRLNEHIKKK